MNGITFIPDFIDNDRALYEQLIRDVQWDERMSARKTASFGVAYNYSQMEYPYQEFLPELLTIVGKLEGILGFRSNNCLINYYMDGRSKMGYHSDQTDILESQTGIAIVSLGDTRTLKFKSKSDGTQLEYPLPSGSLIYMTQGIQEEWLHAIPPVVSDRGRMSLTFRKMK